MYTDGDPIAAANSARFGPAAVAVISQKRIRRRFVLSGLINEYEPAA